MSAIGPGSWLECVASSESTDHLVTINAGRVYRCNRIVPGRWHCQRCGRFGHGVIELEGMVDYVWCPCCFKPGGYRPSADILLLLEKPERVGQDA